MGFCKCRVVTSLFCFDHRKNVCETCILTDHSTCIVKTYLQWLQDSDYVSTCSICKQGLRGDGGKGATVRLPCLDVFHVECLNEYFSSVSRDHYVCPICETPLAAGSDGRIPEGPIGQALKQAILPFDWGRKVIGIGSDVAGAGMTTDSGIKANAGGSGGEVILEINGSNANSNSNSIGTVNHASSHTRLLDTDDDKYGRGKRSNLLKYLASQGLPPHRLILIFLVIFVLSGLFWITGTTTTTTTTTTTSSMAKQTGGIKDEKSSRHVDKYFDDVADGQDNELPKIPKSRIRIPLPGHSSVVNIKQQQQQQQQVVNDDGAKNENLEIFDRIAGSMNHNRPPLSRPF